MEYFDNFKKLSRKKQIIIILIILIVLISLILLFSEPVWGLLLLVLILITTYLIKDTLKTEESPEYKRAAAKSNFIDAYLESDKLL